jgi:hypothetical protein
MVSVSFYTADGRERRHVMCVGESVGLSLGPWVPSDNVSPLAPVLPTPITPSFLSQSSPPVLSRSKSLIILRFFVAPLSLNLSFSLPPSRSLALPNSHTTCTSYIVARFSRMRNNTANPPHTLTSGPCPPYLPAMGQGQRAGGRRVDGRRRRAGGAHVPHVPQRLRHVPRHPRRRTDGAAARGDGAGRVGGAVPAA